jgi:ribosomal protein S18 acetylase RimI-like enzyme
VPIIDIGADRYADCLDVLHRGFATATADFGITADNTPSNPAFWADDAVPAVVAKGYQLFGVELAGRILGCAFVGASRDPSVWSLRHLAVAPEARHQGLGEALVFEAVRRARSGGGVRLRIGIVAENLRLADWYHRLGFVTVSAGNRYPGLVFTVDHLEFAL